MKRRLTTNVPMNNNLLPVPVLFILNKFISNSFPRKLQIIYITYVRMLHVNIKYTIDDTLLK